MSHRNRQARPQGGRYSGDRPRNRGKKSLIDRAYRTAEAQGIQVWCQDEAGPYQTIPYPGNAWAAEGRPPRQDHEYVKAGTAKLLTLFRPATGELRACGVTTATNAVLHPWLKAELATLVHIFHQMFLHQPPERPPNHGLTLPAPADSGHTRNRRPTPKRDEVEQDVLQLRRHTRIAPRDGIVHTLLAGFAILEVVDQGTLSSELNTMCRSDAPSGKRLTP